MHDHSHPEPEFTHSSTCEPESLSHASGMFSDSLQFTVTGKTFTNITNITNHNYAVALGLPSDFRMIPLVDIDLWHEIRLTNSTVGVDHRRKQARVRRLYSTKVEGRKSTLTVAIYQGDDAEQLVGSSWASTVYDGLRQFHQAKGFDPYNQDVARHLGHQLYQLSSQTGTPLAYAYTEDYKSEYPPTLAGNDSDLNVDTESLHIQETVQDLAGANYGSEHADISECMGHDVDEVESSHNEETVQDSAGENCGSEHADIFDVFDCEGYNASKSTSGAPQAYEISTLQDDIPEPALSWSLKYLMVIQLAFILFLALSWAYDHISVSFSMVL
ncbi:hypothetical protein MSAN_00121200 [Mycena sanguinolenta]|uniref:Uncharacterized protein n=1 Tax=Mycena sanguinolenta TaxID=230812 RepID=A0A8H6ZIP3_9AGAR|nr:hypothetical protein MSAN_00121200 [Mycena sanguinolenta]